MPACPARGSVGSVKPYLKLAGAFVAGFLVCLSWNYVTANRYVIVSDKYGRQMMVNQRNGDTWWLDGSKTWQKNDRSDVAAPIVQQQNPYLDVAAP